MRARKPETRNQKPETLRLGTRASPLALTQSRSVARMLETAHPGLSVELVEITTTGDKVRDKPLQEFGGRGVFVKELENALLDRRIDLAVHSLKDLPSATPRGLAIGAIVGREDSRDVAAIRGGRLLEELPPGSVIGTGSPRRRAQLKACYPNLEFAEIRGNVETRLRKVQEGQYAGTILARAGLKRLGLISPPPPTPSREGRGRKNPPPALFRKEGNEKVSMHTLPHSLMLPAPGQGALAIECRARDKRVRSLLQTIHNERVSACVTAERSALQTLGGGCHLPLGALAEIRGKRLHLSVAFGLPDGTHLIRTGGSMPLSCPRELGRTVARILLANEGKEILEKLTLPGT